MSRCLRKPTLGGAVDAESFGFPKLSSQSPPSHFQQYNQGHFTTLPFYVSIAAAVSLMLIARSKMLMSGTRLKPAVALRKLCVKRETSNLSEVCSGSDCHDNNMGALTKWDKNPAQVPPIGLFFCDENDELQEKGKNVVVH